MTDSLWAVIPAAGCGVRAKTQIPKQFVRINGKNLLEWTAQKVLALREVNGLVIAVPKDSQSNRPLTVMAKSLSQAFSKPVILVGGAKTRQGSVALALEKVPAKTKWIMVHDASRPLFSSELFRRVFEAAKIYPGVICGVPVSDTIKSVVGGKPFPIIGSTLSRDGVALVQTPQIFRSDLLFRAHEMAFRNGLIGTDDSQLVEGLGVEIAIVEGERTNFKITYPEDFELAGAILGKSESVDLKGIENTVKLPRRGRFLQRQWITVTGFGFDIHPLVEGRDLILGGVRIPFDKGLYGHSDADVLCHAVADAILGALGMGDIGKLFPPDDPTLEGVRSLDLLKKIKSMISGRAKIVHLDCTIVAQAPRLAPYIDDMRENVAGVFMVPSSKVSVKGVSPENLGSLGRNEGIASYCSATLLKKGRV